MEGVTDACFRHEVAALGGLGGAATEFIRLSTHPIPVRTIRRHLGAAPFPLPLALQFMAPDPRHLAASIANAEQAGARWIDLNFGCPAPGVVRKCAGSALLARPAAIERIVRAATEATSLPVTAKIRAGIDSAARLEDIVEACAQGAAAAICLHARLRTERYTDPPTWAWIARARAHLDRRGHAIVLIGNGGIDSVAAGERMRAQTGCDAVMVGRGALADPFIFRQAAGGQAPTRAEALAFALRYAAAIAAHAGERAALARLKQLLRFYRAGALVQDERTRSALLRMRSREAIEATLCALARDAATTPTTARSAR